MDPLELTLIEVIYRRTLSMEEYDYFEGCYVEVEELDVDRWTLEEAVNRGAHLFYQTWDEYDEKEWVDPGIQSQEEADRANIVIRRLRERYGSQDERDEEYWGE
jgi:hypothetical protein